LVLGAGNFAVRLSQGWKKSRFSNIFYTGKRRFLMNTLYLLIPVFLVLVILGADLAVIFSGPPRSKGFQNKYESGYDRTVKSAGNEKKV
jgi:hypothetical protein